MAWLWPEEVLHCSNLHLTWTASSGDVSPSAADRTSTSAALAAACGSCSSKPSAASDAAAGSGTVFCRNDSAVSAAGLCRWKPPIAPMLASRSTSVGQGKSSRTGQHNEPGQQLHVALSTSGALQQGLTSSSLSIKHSSPPVVAPGGPSWVAHSNAGHPHVRPRLQDTGMQGEVCSQAQLLARRHNMEGTHAVA